MGCHTFPILEQFFFNDMALLLLNSGTKIIFPPGADVASLEYQEIISNRNTNALCSSNNERNDNAAVFILLFLAQKVSMQK